MTRVIALRPEPGLSVTLALGREMGLDIHGAPLFEIGAVSWDAPDPEHFDALLIGSANAIRHGGDLISQFRNKPAYVVGKATEEAARKAGLAIAASGEGGLQEVLDRVEPPARLLRIAGAQRVPLEVPEGLTIETVTVYAAHPLPLERALFEPSGDGAVVLLHSAVAARHFASECDRIGLDRGKLHIAALGPRIAAATGMGWQSVHVCETPRDADLLALAARLCL